MTNEQPPWLKTDRSNDAETATNGEAWDWHDHLAAREALAASVAEAEDEEAEEFMAAYHTLRCLGVVEFSKRVLQVAYWSWRYGIEPEDL